MFGALIGGVLSLGSSLIAGSRAKRREREAQEALKNYKRQELYNPYENIQVSTLGADRQREDLARIATTQANQIVMGGTRGILGLTPALLQQYNAQESQIMQNLEEQDRQRQIMIARGNEMVMNMRERREEQDLAGIGNALNVARQEKANAWNNALQTGMGVINLFDNQNLLKSLGLGQQESLITPLPQKMAGVNTSTTYNPYSVYGENFSAWKNRGV